MKIIEKLKAGKNYHFFSQIYEPQYSHVETIKISIFYLPEKELFVKKNYHDRHTSSEKFTHETETELTEEQMSTHVEKINPDFWGAGFWPGETIESESQILQLIR